MLIMGCLGAKATLSIGFTAECPLNDLGFYLACATAHEPCLVGGKVWLSALRRNERSSFPLVISISRRLGLATSGSGLGVPGTRKTRPLSVSLVSGESEIKRSMSVPLLLVPPLSKNPIGDKGDDELIRTPSGCGGSRTVWAFSNGAWTL